MNTGKSVIGTTCGTGKESAAYMREPSPRSNSVFVQAVLNYLLVCLKDVPRGNWAFALWCFSSELIKICFTFTKYIDAYTVQIKSFLEKKTTEMSRKTCIVGPFNPCIICNNDNL